MPCECPKQSENFASWARAYICTNHHLDQEQQIEELKSGTAAATTNSSCHTPNQRTKQELLYSKIEKLVKAFKGHKCALDFNSSSVNLQ